MKRNLFFFLSCLLIPLVGLQAQVSAYKFSTSIGTYTPITGGTVLGNSTTNDQRFVDPATPLGGTTSAGPGFGIGFNFTFGGVVYDKVGVNANGWISLGASTVNVVASNLPISGTGVQVMAPFTRDLIARTGSEIRIETIGTTPNQKLVVQWSNYKRYSSTAGVYDTDTLNFQVVLNETSNTIQYNYGKVKTAATIVGDPVVGIKGANTSNYLTLDGSFSALVKGAATTSNVDFNTLSGPANGQTITFSPGTCFSPTALAAGSITTTSATLTWTTGGATSWNIQYGLTGFTLGAGTKATATVTASKVISGLLPGTTYQFYVRDSCGPGDVSYWTGPFVVKTLCTAVNTFPWIENFEASTTTIPNCWENETNDNADWIFRAGVIGHGSTVDHTLGTSAGYYAGMDDSHGSVNDTVNNLLTPSFNLTSLTTPRLNFWYFIGNDATLTSKLLIDVYDGTTWHMGVAKITFTTVGWLNYNVNLTPYKSANSRIRFRGVETIDFNSDISIDDIKVEETPNCLAPTALNVTAVTSTSATLGWTTGGASNWKVQYGPTGFALGTGTKVATTSTSLAITGLSASTTYQFYVKDSCNASSVSTYAGPFSFTTPCAPVTSLPWTESFEGLTVGSLPLCFARTSATYWSTNNTSVTTYNRAPRTGTGYATARYGSNDWLFTPDVALTANVTYQFSFWYLSDGLNGWDSVTVKYGQGQNAVAMTRKIGASIKNLTATTTYTRFVGTFTPTVSGNYNLGIYARGNSTPWYLTFDDFALEVAPLCTQPTALSATAVTSTGATLNWTTGGATNWKVQYGPTGFVLGTGIKVAATATSLPITGLLPNTTYQFYVKDSCSASSVSSYAGPISFTTPCAVVTLPFTETWETSSTTAGCWSTQANWALSASASANGVGSRSVVFPFFAVNTGSFSANSPEFTPIPSGYQLAFDHAYATYTTEVDSLKIYYSIDGGATYLLLAGLNGGPSGSLTTSPPQSTAFVPTASQWAPYSINLPFGTNRIRFTAKTAYGNNLYMDNISVQPIPLCSAPTGLGTYGTTISSSNLFWTTGGASNWRVQYGPTGFTLGSGTKVSSANDTLAVAGLMANTTYQFYVKDSCSASLVSSWAGPFSFTTLCSAINSFPWIENFEASTTSIPACWVNETNDNADWIFRAGAIGHGATTDHTLGTAAGYYAGMDDSQSNANDTVNNLLTPTFDLSSLTTPRLNFWYYIGNDNVLTSKLLIDVYDGTTWHMGVSKITFTQTGWLNHNVNLTAYKSATSRIRFRGVETTDFNSDISIDDIKVEETPSCVAPTALNVTALTSTSATLNWTTGGASNWKVQYGPTGFVLGTGTKVAATSTSLNITGLTPNTTYQFYVKDSCNALDVSVYTGPFSFTTPCAIVTLPYVESWETSSTTVGCWTTQANWALSTAVSAYGVGSNSVIFPFYSVSSGSFNANSPQFTPVPAGYQLAFDHAYATYATEVDSLNIFYSTDGGVTFIKLVGLNGGVNGNLTTAPPSIGSFAPTATQWSNYTINLPVGTNRLRFTAKTAFGNNLYLDNIAVQLTPVCPAPTALGAFGIAQTTANIRWTSTGTAFNVEYGPTGFTLGAGTTLSLVANDTTMLSGLTAQSCYDFYVQTACASDSSAWVGPFNICTLPVPSACNVVNSAKNDTLCAPGTAKFYSSTTNGLVRFNTNNLVTLSTDTVRLAVTGTTSIQVAEVVNGTNKGHVGPLPTIAALGFGNFTNGQKITALDTIRIDSMTVRANGVVTAQVQIYTKDPAKGGVLLQTGKPFTTGAGADATYKVEVGTVLTPGSYFMNVSFISGTGMLFRSTGGAVYPYILPGLMRIDSTNFATQNRLYYTFDIVVSEVCISPKKTVTAQLIGLNPGLSKTVVLCDNAPSVNLTSYLSANAAAGGTFKAGAATSAVTGTMLNPSLLTPGVYKIYYKTLGTSACPADSSTFTFYIQNCSGCSTLVTPVTTNDTICGPGFATVSATGSNLLWYNPSDSVLVGGNTFTDSVGVNTTYNVVSAFSAGPAITLGPKVTTASNVYPTGNFTNGQYITVSKTVRIDSATFAVNGPLNFVTVIWDAQRTTVLQQSKVISFAAKDTAAKEIGVVLTPGVYFMNTAPISGTGILYRMAAGGAFPYGVPGYFTADSSDFGPARYYYFNDMKVSSACLSPAATAMAVVATGFNAGASATDTVCDTLMVDLSTYLGTFDMGGTWVDVNATGALTGTMFNAYAVAKNATYTFRYEGGVGNCGDTATISLYVDYCSIGLNEFSKAGLIVYPNPTNGVVYVESLRKNSQNMVVEVFGMSGKLIFRKEFDGNQKAEMELSTLPDGVYNLKVSNDNGTSVHRIVKQ